MNRAVEVFRAGLRVGLFFLGLRRLGRLRLRGRRRLTRSAPIRRRLDRDQNFLPDLEIARAGSSVPFRIQTRAGSAVRRAEFRDRENELLLFHLVDSVFQWDVPANLVRWGMQANSQLIFADSQLAINQPFKRIRRLPTDRQTDH